tara:strand:- start:531 stop:1025 length:495 start_codon:yes stop_codon:yes gene_type:complete
MYKKKCLFRNTNGTWGKEASAVETVWAYLHGVEKKSTGRYRIRITKLSGQELVAMGLAPEETPPSFFGMQANLDKWNESIGWIPCFDWVGDPESSMSKIEKDLNAQFRAFVTGISLEEDFSFDLPEPPKKKSVKLPPKPKEEQKEDVLDEPSKDSDDDPDFEWL